MLRPNIASAELLDPVRMVRLTWHLHSENRGRNYDDLQHSRTAGDEDKPLNGC